MEEKKVIYALIGMIVAMGLSIAFIVNFMIK
jgi:hypothetical protein